MCVRACVCVSVSGCVRECARVHACVRVRVCVCVAACVAVCDCVHTRLRDCAHVGQQYREDLAAQHCERCAEGVPDEPAKDG